MILYKLWTRLLGISARKKGVPQHALSRHSEPAISITGGRIRPFLRRKRIAAAGLRTGHAMTTHFAVRPKGAKRLPFGPFWKKDRRQTSDQLYIWNKVAAAQSRICTSYMASDQSTRLSSNSRARIVSRCGRLLKQVLSLSGSQLSFRMGVRKQTKSPSGMT